MRRWLKIRTVPENHMCPEVGRRSVLILIQYRIWTPWNQQVSKSTKPKLVVTRIWKLHLQQHKKRAKRLWLNGDRHLALAHLDAFHCRGGFCYNTGCHLSFGEKCKQSLPTAALPMRSSSVEGGVDYKKSPQRSSRTWGGSGPHKHHWIKSPTTSKSLD